MDRGIVEDEKSIICEILDKIGFFLEIIKGNPEEMHKVIRFKRRFVMT